MKKNEERMRKIEKEKEEKKKRKMDNTGIDPVTYRMQSDRSTIWASHPIDRLSIFSSFQLQDE